MSHSPRQWHWQSEKEKIKQLARSLRGFKRQSLLLSRGHSIHCYLKRRNRIWRSLFGVWAEDAVWMALSRNWRLISIDYRITISLEMIDFFSERIYPSCLRKSSRTWTDWRWYCNSDSTRSFKQRKWWFYEDREFRNSRGMRSMIRRTWELFSASSIKRVISSWRSKSAWAWRSSVSEL